MKYSWAIIRYVVNIIHVFFIIGTNDMDNNAKNVNGVIVKYILCFKIIDDANINLLAQEP